MKTAKSLLALKDGIECWRLLRDEDQAKEVLKPFVTTLQQSKSNGGIAHKEPFVLSSNYINMLKLIIGDSSPVNDSTWCWNDELWKCDYGNELAKEDCWIKDIVVAMIACYFEKESKVQSCSFIRMCQCLSARESSFASCIFPGLIYSLLDGESSDQKQDKLSIRDLVLSDTAVGSPTGKMNKSITHCFARILSSCCDSDDSSAAPYAVKVVLGTLEMLHSVTKQRFISSSYHKKNSSELPKEYSSTSKKSRKSTDTKTHILPNPPTWRGVPFGVVLRLDGLDIARAYLKLNQYYSAIYFW
jgi:hypothetical protein